MKLNPENRDGKRFSNPSADGQAFAALYLAGGISLKLT
jgi:hypothetical protein